MKLIMFAGAGSVGKTKLLEAVAEQANKLRLDVATHCSTTRKTYANAGLTNEKQAFDNETFNMKFQDQVMKDNIDGLWTAVIQAQNDNKSVLITDRSPYDYAGYFFNAFRDKLDLTTIAAKRYTCDESIAELTYRCDEIHIIFLPYPTSWAVDTDSSDGWRADKTGKNFLWSCAVESELADAERRLEAHMSHPATTCKLTISRLDSIFERGPVEARTWGVLAKAFPHLR